MHRLQKFLEARALQQQLRLVQVVERIAKVDQHQVALVTQHRVRRELPSFFAGRKRLRHFARNLRPARCIELAPLQPT